MFELLLLAAAMAGATPEKAEPTGNPARWVTAFDLPDTKGEVAVTSFDLVIGETGRPLQCTIVVPSGSDRLDQAVCTTLIKRARFKPAKDASGSPILGVYRDRIIYRPDVIGQNAWLKAPDLVVTTAAVQGPLKGVSEVLVELSSAGTVNDCLITHSIGDAALDKLACDVARNSKISSPIADAEGVFQRGIRSFYVGFAPGNAFSVSIR